MNRKKRITLPLTEGSHCRKVRASKFKGGIRTPQDCGFFVTNFIVGTTRPNTRALVANKSGSTFELRLSPSDLTKSAINHQKSKAMKPLSLGTTMPRRGGRKKCVFFLRRRNSHRKVRALKSESGCRSREERFFIPTFLRRDEERRIQDLEIGNKRPSTFWLKLSPDSFSSLKSQKTPLKTEMKPLSLGTTVPKRRGRKKCVFFLRQRNFRRKLAVVNHKSGCRSRKERFFIPTFLRRDEERRIQDLEIGNKRPSSFVLNLSPDSFSFLKSQELVKNKMKPTPKGTTVPRRKEREYLLRCTAEEINDLIKLVEGRLIERRHLLDMQTIVDLTKLQQKLDGKRRLMPKGKRLYCMPLVHASCGKTLCGEELANE